MDILRMTNAAKSRYFVEPASRGEPPRGVVDCVTRLDVARQCSNAIGSHRVAVLHVSHGDRDLEVEATLQQTLFPV